MNFKSCCVHARVGVGKNNVDIINIRELCPRVRGVYVSNDTQEEPFEVISTRARVFLRYLIMQILHNRCAHARMGVTDSICNNVTDSELCPRVRGVYSSVQVGPGER